MKHPTCPWCNSNRTDFNFELFEPVGPGLYSRFTEYLCSGCGRTFLDGDGVLVNSNNEPVDDKPNPTGTWYLAPVDDRSDEWRAGYDGNSFLTEPEALEAREGLARETGTAAEDWVPVFRSTNTNNKESN